MGIRYTGQSSETPSQDQCTGQSSRTPSLDQCTCSGCESECESLGATENSPLMPSSRLGKPTPLPKLQIAALLLVSLPESVTSTLIYPFVVQLVRSLGVAKGDPERVGYYSGAIESCFFVTEALFVFFWGRLSDKFGRKPVLLFGSFGLAIALLCFGFSTTLFGVLASRALQGALNGNTGVVRAMLSEVTDASNRAQAFSFTSIVWAGGSTLGPLAGGFLANPADHFPAFANEFWHSHPYLLPCTAAGSLSLAAFISTLFCIKETHSGRTSFLSKITRTKLARESYGTIESGQNSHSPDVTDPPAPTASPKFSEVFTSRLLCVLVNQALIAILNHSYIALMAVFLATPITSGGLGLSASRIGLILGTTGLVHGTLQTFCFAPLYRTFDPKKLYTFCIAMVLPIYASFPCINALARAHGLAYPGLWVLVVFQLLWLQAGYTAFSAMYIFVSNSSPTLALLGTTNGLAQTVFSSMGAIGPVGVTSLFAVSVERDLLGGHLVYVVMCAINVLAVLASVFLLPEKPGEEVSAAKEPRGD